MIQEIKFSDILEQVKLFLQFCLKNSKLFFIIIFLTCSIAYFYWYTLKSNFKATTTFIVEESSSKGGGLSGIASQFGVDLGSVMGGNGSSLFSGDNIFEIIKSRKIIEKVLLSKTEEMGKIQPITMADFYMNITGFGKTLEKNNINKNDLNFSNLNPDENHTIVQDSVLNVIYNKLILENIFVEKQNKKSTLITISVNSSNQLFSKLFSERLLKETSELYIDIKVGNLSKSVNKIQQKADSLKNTLSNIYQNSFQINSSRSELSSRDKTFSSTLYAEVVKNLETLKLSLINQTPIIQTLDLPRLPLKDTKTSVLIIMIVGFFSGIIVTTILLLFKYKGQ
jgi:uncharacterized protein involved in exopolysaccharide biosynthesis